MSLFSETGGTLRWAFQILRQLLRVAPGVTLAVGTYLTVARITRLLAFLVPLKVILLAGSSGIPSYFRPFVSPEHKETGIVVLSVVAIVSYALTLFLEARSKRLSDNVAADLLSATGVMSLVANQRAEMQGIYLRVMQAVSAGLFVVAALFTLALINPLLAAYLVGLALCFYLLTAWALGRTTLLTRHWLADMVRNRLGNYLGILSSVAFLSGFLVILQPFLTEAGGNILIAIICILLLRQLTGALVGAVRDVVALVQKRHLADTLVFPDRQFQKVEGNDQRTLRELFRRQDREVFIAEQLAGLRQPGDAMRVEWLDSSVRGMAEFSVSLKRAKEVARFLRLRVFPPRLRSMVENEDLLFRHVAREAVWAPPVVGRFMRGEHECVVYDTGKGAAPKAAVLSARHHDFIVSLWSADLPPALVGIYRASHKVLHERLTDDLAARMDVAIDTGAAGDTLDRFRTALPAIRELLANMPLCLIHPSFTPGKTVLGQHGAIHVLGGWGEWSLEPAGAGLPASFADQTKLAALLADMRGRNPDVWKDRVTGRHLAITLRCGLLEQAVVQGKMKAALALAHKVLADLDAVQGAAAREDARETPEKA